jgi:hypothetical protein
MPLTPNLPHPQRHPPTEPKLVTDNYDRLLAILERNAASTRERELVARLRDAIGTIRSSRRA